MIDRTQDLEDMVKLSTAFFRDVRKNLFQGRVAWSWDMHTRVRRFRLQRRHDYPSMIRLSITHRNIEMTVNLIERSAAELNQEGDSPLSMVPSKIRLQNAISLINFWSDVPCVARQLAHPIYASKIIAATLSPLKLPSLIHQLSQRELYNLLIPLRHALVYGPLDHLLPLVNAHGVLKVLNQILPVRQRRTCPDLELERLIVNIAALIVSQSRKTLKKHKKNPGLRSKQHEGNLHAIAVRELVCLSSSNLFLNAVNAVLSHHSTSSVWIISYLLSDLSLIWPFGGKQRRDQEALHSSMDSLLKLEFSSASPHCANALDTLGALYTGTKLKAIRSKNTQQEGSSSSSKGAPASPAKGPAPALQKNILPSGGGGIPGANKQAKDGDPNTIYARPDLIDVNAGEELICGLDLVASLRRDDTYHERKRGRRCGGCLLLEDNDQRQHFLRCSSCKLVLYCSRECQLEHWSESHSKRCTHAPVWPYPNNREEHATNNTAVADAAERQCEPKVKKLRFADEQQGGKLIEGPGLGRLKPSKQVSGGSQAAGRHVIEPAAGEGCKKRVDLK